MTKMSTRADPGDDEGRVNLLCPERSSRRLHGHSPSSFFQYSFPKLKTLIRVKKTNSLVTCVKNLKRANCFCIP